LVREWGKKHALSFEEQSVEIFEAPLGKYAAPNLIIRNKDY
jgi:hypothetical protein